MDILENLSNMHIVLGVFLHDTDFLKLKNLILQLGNAQLDQIPPAKWGRVE